MAGKGIPFASEPVKNIVLVGRLDNGKSATGNTLLGDHKFKLNFEERRDYNHCKMFRAATQGGPIINVIDTPGMCSIKFYLAYQS